MQVIVEQDKANADVNDGEHRGVISDLKIRTTDNYQYLDVVLALADQQPTVGSQALQLTAGFPLPIRPGNMTGQMFGRFGVKVVSGGMVETNSLLNRMVVFTTVKKPGRKDASKLYTEVVRETLRPLDLVKVGV